VVLPDRRRPPLVRLALRIACGLGLTCFVAAVAYLDRKGYRDAAGGPVGLLDAIYYATVSITTTGYGDVTPVTERARLLTTILVTPARILFLILLVGTTLEVLAEGSRAAVREQFWRRKLRDHIIVCGFGTKGRSALEVLHGHGKRADQVVVVDRSAERCEEATRRGYAAIRDDAVDADVLRSAHVAQATAVVIAVDRDDSAVLITLTARELNPTAKIISAVKEDTNRHLLHQSGADSVITSSGAAGRLLGFAALSPKIVEVLEDLLSVGSGLDVLEREVEPEYVGRPLTALPAVAPIIAVIRADRVLRFDDPELRELHAGDRLVGLTSHR
jgi:voltage-gated potassium channel